MSTPISKYEKLYRANPAVCGEPFPEFMQFANRYEGKGRSVLDLGCGQGRDALVFARNGFHVVGVDHSSAGISQMIDQANDEGLSLRGIVADIRDYIPADRYDIIVIDRTLHMLECVSDRIIILERCAQSLNVGGHLLMADERSNMPDFVAFFESEGRQWKFQEGLKSTFIFATLVSHGIV